MSLATFKGGGIGGFVLFRNQYRRRQSYLQRNVRNSIRHLIMGSTISSFRTPSGLRSRDEVVAPPDEEDEEDPRPVKRRRTSMFEAAASRNEMNLGSGRLWDQVTDEEYRKAPRASTKVQPVQPSDFYGKSRPASTRPQVSKRADFQPKTPRSSIHDVVLPPTTTNFKKAIRLVINSVVLKSQQEGESVSFMRGRRSIDVMEIPCRCSVAFFSAKNDGNPEAPITQKDYQELFRRPNTCILKTTIDHEGKVARKLIDLEPFVFPKHDLFTTRKKRNHLGQFVQSWGFAEDYYVSITLEPLGVQKQWPPFDPSSLINSNIGSLNPVTDLLEAGKIINTDLHLIANMKNLFDPSRQNKSASLKLSHGQLRQDIPFSLKFEISWSLPSHLSDLSNNIELETGSPQINTMAPRSSELISVSPLAHKGRETPASESQAERREKRRRSNVATYNLKDLSTIQQGKSPRARKSRDIRSRSAQGKSEDTEGSVATYTFGKADAAQLFIKQTTTVAGLHCPICRHRHHSFDDLRIHLHMNHTELKFSLRRSTTQRLEFFLEIAKRGLRGSPTSLGPQARTFQLSHPRTLFNLDKFLNGDESWVKSREGPQHNLWPEHLQDRFHESSSSSSHVSRQSSPNTSNATDDMMEYENFCSKLPSRPRKKFFVPKTTKPLYDTITKQILVPGMEIPNSDDEKDEQWLHQKHRDIIMDYGDVTDDEKDYIVQWNPFIMTEQLTNEIHLGDAILRFVEENKVWFAQKLSRKKEFGKTMETFLMRGAVDGKCLDRCISILKEAEKNGSKEKVVAEAERPVSPAKQRGGLDCDCGGHTQPPDRVICRGEVRFSGSEFLDDLLTPSNRTAQEDFTIANAQRSQDDQSKSGGYVIIAFLRHIRGSRGVHMLN